MTLFSQSKHTRYTVVTVKAILQLKWVLNSKVKSPLEVLVGTCSSFLPGGKLAVSSIYALLVPTRHIFHVDVKNGISSYHLTRGKNANEHLFSSQMSNCSSKSATVNA